MSLKKNDEGYMKSIGILGGTFDPVHNAHLVIADYVLKKLNLEQVRFIPCHIPPHRPTPKASAKDRLEMLKLATKDNPQFVVDNRELKRADLSYSVDTLKSLREELGQRPFCFILGEDAFVKFNEWKDWKTILTLTHLIVINRPDTALPNTAWMHNLLKQHQIHNSNLLQSKSAGFIYQLTLPPMTVSATKIRKQLINYHLSLTTDLPETVVSYIKKNKLYLSFRS